ncbi:hypothetical protein [Vitiosangium sp. GDMCC 1.1324]|uniref:hypothetical protein n=1 Tax=Vitiosangium sp. (strain GDMCC 1.1324) TaxID=2138576 RepID=UPI000D38FDA0|nr:hypothetical protein [Vitiosangium sp. GDMCC 1.1324]PTL77055.1 hypothetical protein DAT35_46260 [Vitiosangium sp. GDMCC 1.1324]
MTDAPSTRMLALFQGAGIQFESAEDAWRRAEHLYPLLGWLTARFPDERAFGTCAEWLRLCASRIEDAAPAAELFAQARSGAHPRQAHIVAGKLGDLRNEWILARKPAAAAFADAASHLCEVWAAVTTGEMDAETEPWARGKAAAGAMVTAWLYQQGLKEDDKAEREKARIALTGLLRTARAAGHPEET